MSRSLKKWFYTCDKLLKRVISDKETWKKAVRKTWCRAGMIFPEHVWATVAVHNWKSHIPVFITEDMVWHKFGEFAMTRTFKGHAGSK